MIGQLREGPLHRDLKQLLAGPGDAFEVKVDGYVIDLVRADGELVEVQTGSFSPLRAKLDALLDRHRMRIVHPIPAQRRILRVDEHGEVLSTRPSPKKPKATTIFDGLVSFPTLLSHPNLTIEVMLCRPADGATSIPVDTSVTVELSKHRGEIDVASAERTVMLIRTYDQAVVPAKIEIVGATKLKLRDLR